MKTSTATSEPDVKPYLADGTLRIALRLAVENPDIGVVLTTKSGTRYLIIQEHGMFLATRKDASVLPGEHTEQTWYRVGSQIQDFKVLNIWGSLEFGPWKTTDVVKVQLKKYGESGDSSLFTVFER